jgi:hypothetical protein
MMSRPERAMQLTAQIYILDRLKSGISEVFEEAGFVYKQSLKSGGLPTKLSEMKDELREIKRQMGGGERRRFEQMLESWKGDAKANQEVATE